MTQNLYLNLLHTRNTFVKQAVELSEPLLEATSLRFVKDSNFSPNLRIFKHVAAVATENSLDRNFEI